MTCVTLETNIVWEGHVAYKQRLIEEAKALGYGLRCVSRDQPGQVMTVPNFLIDRRVNYGFSKKLHYDDVLGKECPLGYIFWRPDGPDPNQKTLF